MKPTGATKEAMGHSPLPWHLRASGVIATTVDNVRFIARIIEHEEGALSPQEVADGEFIITAVNERERLRAALRAALNSLSRTVRKSYPNYPEEQMQISETMTVADARVILNDATTSTSAGGG